MKEAISDFRVETEDFRREDEDGELQIGPAASQGQGQEQPKKTKRGGKGQSRDLGSLSGEGQGAPRRRKKKGKKDPVLAMWAGADAHKKISDPIDLAEGIAKSLAEGAKRMA